MGEMKLAMRSVLYVPGDSAAKLQRAFERGADGLIVDLEDAVAPAAKDGAREAVAAWLVAFAANTATAVWVRVNNGPRLAVDIAAVVQRGLSGVCLPKCSSVAELAHLDGLLHAAEVANDVLPRSVGVWPLIESAAGLLVVADLARSPRVVGLQLGEVDLMAELGMIAGDDEEELRPFRTAIVVASIAAGLGAPIAPVSPQWQDEHRYRRSTESLARMGFGGRVCIHPSQVAISNELFTPSRERVEWARRVLARFEVALAEGLGAVVDEDGQLLDEAIARGARRVVALAAMADHRTR